MLGLGCKKGNLIQSKNAEHNIPAVAMSGKADVYLSPNGYLIFPTREIYETTINNLNTMDDPEMNAWEQDLGYTSTYDRFYDEAGDSLNKYDLDGEINNNSSVRDLLFARLISANGMVQIENTIYRITSDSMLMYTLNTQNYEEHYADFAQGKFNTSFMNRLSGDFEINPNDPNDTTSFFDYIQLFKVNLNMRTLNIFVRTSGSVVGPISEAPGGTIQSRAKAEAFYNNYVIYRSIKCTFHYQAKDGGFWVPKKTDVRLSWIGNEVDTKCVVELNKDSNYSDFAPATDLYYNEHHVSHLKWKPYHGTKRVMLGSAYATFVYKDINTNQDEEISTNILNFPH